MDADLDLLLTTVFATADDLLPEASKKVMRRVTDAEVVTRQPEPRIPGRSAARRFHPRRVRPVAWGRPAWSSSLRLGRMMWAPRSWAAASKRLRQWLRGRGWLPGAGNCQLGRTTRSCSLRMAQPD